MILMPLIAAVAVTLAFVYKDNGDRWHYGHNDE